MSEASAVTVVSDLLAAAPIESGKLGHHTVLKSEDVRVIVLAFEAGHVMKDHAAPKTLIMQALDGELRVVSEGTTMTLTPGTIVRFSAGVRHEVEAVANSRLMLTLIG
ncbi:AraC family ligand binding domain-containing protein [Salinibacterium sp. SYSU T00001]|uniref:cupin domain-containing protein n=1 Tax=Homoserinimonas sedimenticola TaxID=2986805 RepID=UPI0022357B1D|nr:cupin domain-containing protein [Salinibacterium sedimenticola]MCW4386311.1 AraC family ligand binding domain-containing protein [Salinibacterium sedimenticola]